MNFRPHAVSCPVATHLEEHGEDTGNDTSASNVELGCGTSGLLWWLSWGGSLVNAGLSGDCAVGVDTVGGDWVTGSVDGNEVGARNAGLVAQVNDNREVTKVANVGWVGGGVQISVPISSSTNCFNGKHLDGNLLERAALLGEVAPLAAQVTNLALLLGGWITSWDLAALVRVQVSTSSSAVAVSWNGLLVDVVHWQLGQ